MLDGYFARTAQGQRVALVTGTNEEADTLNESIQRRRLANGELNPSRWVLGAEGQRVHVGDTVQTRRNDSAAGVENRAHRSDERREGKKGDDTGDRRRAQC